MKIEFDPGKDAANIAKHGLSLADASWVYHAPDKLTLSSPKRGEDRRLDVALVEAIGVVLALVYVERGDTVRAISLRRASRAERKLYETWDED